MTHQLKKNDSIEKDSEMSETELQEREQSIITIFMYLKEKVNSVRRKMDNIFTSKQIGVPHMKWECKELCGPFPQ